MQIFLTSVENDLTTAWREYCGKYDFVTVIPGSILNLEVECVVSPSNSFCFMDGGIDALYTAHFGLGVQQRLQRKIVEEFDGELLIGQAALVDTRDDKIPYLIAAPTMRTPTLLPPNTVNPYLAAKATLTLAMNEGIKSIAFPGLGTGVGRVDPKKCSLQVAQAISDVVLGNYKFPTTWGEALDMNSYLYTGLKSIHEYPGA